jgi:5-methylcytosine-specific restriction protein A
MTRNPPWTRDELILALDLYFRVGRKHEGPAHPEVVQLSQHLNALPMHGAQQRADFRNPAGVAMKLANYLALDPDYPGTGLQRGNRLERDVWDTFAGDPARLRATAAAILAGQGALRALPPVPEEEEFPEGAVLTRLHTARERNRRLITQKKAAVLAATGHLACEVCQFDFAARYGALGHGFAECHHTVPLAALPTHTGTRLSDLAILCANCHRMIHRTRPLMRVADFHELVRTMGGRKEQAVHDVEE